jgi:hypothetical protein
MRIPHNWDHTTEGFSDLAKRMLGPRRRMRAQGPPLGRGRKSAPQRPTRTNSQISQFRQSRRGGDECHHLCVMPHTRSMLDIVKAFESRIEHSFTREG